MTLINALSTLYEPYKKVYAMYPLNTLILINLLSKLYDLNKQNEKIKCVQSSSSSILHPRSSILDPRSSIILILILIDQTSDKVSWL